MSKTKLFEMIDAKDLRIGNWAFDKDGELFQIEELTPYYEGCHYRWEWLKEINPVPLTEDILIKAGFIRCEFGLLMPNRASFYLNLDQSGWHLYLSIRHHSEYLISTFRYLHQLQNLYYAIIGEELNITL